MDNSDYLDIYQNEAEGYERLVAREDYEGNILPALEEICDLNGRVVIDMGAGTGRLMKLVAPQAAAVFGFDNSRAMLAVGRRELQQAAVDNWALTLADHRDLPVGPASCDLTLSGWSLAYLALDQGPEWRDGLRRVFRRLRETVRAGGAIIILETMGTGYTEPNPPSFMLDYYAFLSEVGLQSKWIRTDYEFESLAEAVTLTRFFFGEELAQQVEKAESRFLPECTGIWWTNDVNGLLLDS
jgi:ubiquinone/menaquinone biosynthesis C-methylase UbiE